MELDKSAFFEDIGYEPHEGQLVVHKSMAPRRVLACGVRWGKSRCAAMEAIAAAMEPRDRSIGWVCAPTYDLADKVYREIVLIVAENLRHRIITMRDGDKRLVLRNLAGGVSELRAKSADNPVSLLGEGLDWLIVDEASRLKPTIWEGHLSQRLIDKKGWALLISTPKAKGWFFDLFRRGQSDDPDYESWNAPSWQNPHLDASLIEAERERLPERVFLQEYEGQFLEGSGSVFRYVRDAATGDWEAPNRGKSYYAGLDLAKVNDFTVLTIMDSDGRVVFVDRYNRVDWSTQLHRIAEATRRYNHAYVYVDSTGAGEPVYERLCETGVNCEGYAFTARSKAALVDNLAMMLEQRRLVLPRYELWSEGIEELEAFQFSVTDSGNVKTSAPGGQHDDCVVSLALAAWGVNEAIGAPLQLATYEPGRGFRLWSG